MTTEVTEAPVSPAPAAPARFPSREVSRKLALGALALLVMVCVALATAFAAPGSKVVLASVGGSPGWLLGPWRAFGASGADGALAGPLFYAGLWVAMLAYVAVLATARAIGARLAIGAIVSLHLIFLLAPPLLSQDVFSYVSYARLDVLHSLNPYTHSPNDVPTDAAYAFAGSKSASSVYGPLFTIATLPLAKLSVPSAFWTLKAVAAAASLAIVALVWGCARLLGRDPVFCAIAVGLNPLVLVHVVGGAHNDALAVALWMGAALALVAAPRATGALVTASAGIKASAGLVFPFMLAIDGNRRRLIAGALATGVGIVAASVAAFGTKAIDALVLIGQNQDKTSSWSIPRRSADGIGALTRGSPDTIVHFTRGAFALAFAALVVLLMQAAWRRRHERDFWIDAAGWTTLGLLVASAWLVPWYAIWLMPLAALARDRRLLVASLSLCAYMLVIAVPL